MLLHGVADCDYSAPEARDSPRRASSRQGGQADSPWKPTKYNGTGLLVPGTREEDIVLLLLLAEVMASKHVSLNQGGLCVELLRPEPGMQGPASPGARDI